MLSISIEEKLRNRLDSKSVKKHKLIRRFLRDYKVDLNNLYRMDALYISILNNDLKMFKLLQEYGANIDVEEIELYFYRCIEHKNPEFLEYILNNVELTKEVMSIIIKRKNSIVGIGGMHIVNRITSMCSEEEIEELKYYNEEYR
jgi:hypothetical protein